MSDLTDLVFAEAILPRLAATSRRQVLQAMADALAKASGAEARPIFDAVLLRERLAGTGMGEGVAIPHAQIKGLERPLGAFARLDPSHDFGAMDNRPADLVFLLATPAERSADHLKALARVSRFFRKAEMRDRLRAARGVEDLQALFAGTLRSDAA